MENLLHFGIKGMHWGVRKSQDSGGGGGKAPRGKSVSVDAARVEKVQKKLKSRGLSSLSNQELKALNERMNLEQNYANLTKGSSNVAKMKKGQNVAREILGVGKMAKEAYDLYNSPMIKQVTKMLENKSGG